MTALIRVKVCTFRNEGDTTYTIIVDIISAKSICNLAKLQHIAPGPQYFPFVPRPNRPPTQLDRHASKTTQVKKI